jgi:nitrous oxidase accessory protein NosD
MGPSASGSTVSGFTVKNAIGEGILLTAVDHVTVSRNRVTNNDKGAHTSVYPPCADNGPVPGDCGEAIHLQGTTNSKIVSNRVDHNIGGVLVTDEAGPTSGNLIAGNMVVDNAEDCGITMPAHVAGLGVTNNTVEGNYIARNGGAGVLIATPGPGMAVTGNLVTRNIIVNNGEGGVQLHAHAPNQSIDDNTITNNLIGTNNTAGDKDSGDLKTSGIIVFSAVVPVQGLVVDHNVIFNDRIGIWLSVSVDASGITHNKFVNVATPVHQ